MSKSLIRRNCQMKDKRGKACGKLADRSFTISVPLDTKEKELIFWCCDLHYEAFKHKFPQARLKKVTVAADGFVVSKE